MRWVQLTPEMAASIVETGQLGLLLPMTPDHARDAASGGMAWGLELGGRIVGIGGILPTAKPRATAWMIAPPILEARIWGHVLRKIRTVIADAHGRGYRRIEAHVHERFPRGGKFCERLGFELEAYCPCFFEADFAGAFQWARIDPPVASPLL